MTAVAVPTRSTLLTRALDALKAGGPDRFLLLAPRVPEVWAEADEDQRADLRVGLIPVEDGRPVLPIECAGVFTTAVLRGDGTEDQGINIGAMVGRAVEAGLNLDAAFDGLHYFDGAEHGEWLIGPLACAVAYIMDTPGDAESSSTKDEPSAA